LVESGAPLKSHFGGQGATPRPDSEYAECYVYIVVVDVVKGSQAQSASQLGKVKRGTGATPYHPYSR